MGFRNQHNEGAPSPEGFTACAYLGRWAPLGPPLRALIRGPPSQGSPGLPGPTRGAVAAEWLTALCMLEAMASTQADGFLRN